MQRTGRRVSRRRHSTTATPMSLPELERWLRGRADRQPAATSVAMLDGYVAAIVAGPVSIDPLDWICPLLAVDADAFNHGDTPEFAAISAVARHHNDISQTLSTAPHRFQSLHQRKPNGDVDARPWCEGFYATMRLRLSDWAPLLDLNNINHRLLLPILLHCVDDRGHPMLGPPKQGRETEEFPRNAHTDIPTVVEAMRQYGLRGTSCRLPPACARLAWRASPELPSICSAPASTNPGASSRRCRGRPCGRSSPA